MAINSPTSVGPFLTFRDQNDALLAVTEDGSLANLVFFDLEETKIGLLPIPAEQRTIIVEHLATEMHDSFYSQLLRDWKASRNQLGGEKSVSASSSQKLTIENPLTVSNAQIKRTQIASLISINPRLLEPDKTLMLLQAASTDLGIMSALPYTKSQIKSYLEQIVSVIHYLWAIVDEDNPNQAIAVKIGVSSNRARNLIMFARGNGFLTQSSQGEAFGLATNTFFQTLEEIITKLGEIRNERT